MARKVFVGTHKWKNRGCAPLSALLMGTALLTILPATVRAQTWQEAGPQNLLNSEENAANSGWSEAVGAVQVILPQPGNANVLYAGSVNGGVWKSSDGGASWTVLTDNQASLSIGALAMNGSDSNWLVAGIGHNSNAASGGPLLDRVLQSHDGGATWSQVDVGSGKLNVVSMAFAGNDLFVASTDYTYAGSLAAERGLYRRNADGTTARLGVAPDDAAALAAGELANDSNVTAVAIDPHNSKVVYAAVSNGADSTLNGVYRSTDGGNSWKRETDILTGGDVSEVFGPAANIKLAVAADGSLYAAVATNPGYANVTSVLRRDPATGQWKTLELSPAFLEKQSGQAISNLAFAVSPTDPNVVYLGTAPDFLVRGVYNPATGAVDWTSAADAETGAPHVDFRSMAFDALGRLLATSDGGVYRTATPATGGWSSLGAGLGVAETYKAAWNPVSHTPLAALQDNGVFMGPAAGGHSWTAVEDCCDGVNVEVNATSRPGQAIVYASGQSLYYLSRTVYDAANNELVKAPLLPLVNGDITIGEYESGFAWSEAFMSQLALNKLHPKQFALASYRVYAGQDDLAALPETVPVKDISGVNAGTAFSSLSYGTKVDSDEGGRYALVAGAGAYEFDPTYGQVFFTANAVADAAAGHGMTETNWTDGAVTSVVLNRDDVNKFYVANGVSVYATADQGASYVQNGATLPATLTNARSLEYLSNNGVHALLTGGITDGSVPNKIYATENPDAGADTTWTAFGGGIPNVLVTSLTYDDSDDVLVAATMGRGVWLVYDVTSNFASASSLWFGKANNDSNPDAAILTGERPLEKFGWGTLAITGAASYVGPTTIHAGSLRLDGSILGDVTVEAGGLLRGVGSAGGAVGGAGAVMPGNYTPGTALTVGAYTPAADATFLSLLAPGAANRLIVTGKAELDGNGRLVYLPQGGRYVEGASYTILQAGSVSGTFAADANNALTRFLRLDTVYSPTSVAAIVERSANYADAAMSEGARKVAPALDRGRPTAGGDFAAILNALDNASNDAEADGAMTQMAGGPKHLQNRASSVATNLMAGSVQTRLARLNGGQTGGIQLAATPGGGLAVGDDGMVEMSGVSAGDSGDMLTSGGWWAKGLFSYGVMDPDAVGNGYKQHSGGGMVGHDAALPDYPDITVGLAAGYLRTSLTTPQGQAASTDSYRLLAYGGWAVGPATFDANLGYGYNRHDLSRRIAFDSIDRTATADTTGHEGSVGVGATLRLAVADAVTLLPHAGLNYQREWQDGYTESGAGSLDQIVEDKAYDNLRSSLGMAADVALTLGGGWSLVPEARAAWERDWLDPSAADVKLTGAPAVAFTGVEARTPKDALALGVGLSLVNGGGLRSFADYDVRLNNRETTQTFTAGLRAEF